MGGDTFKDEEESSRSSLSPCSCCFSDDLGFKDVVSKENFPNFSNHPADLRRRDKAYHEILQSHDLLLRSSKRKVRQARTKILSYTPGTWSDVKLSDYNVPKTTSILIVGPKGAGKSSLINRVTRVIEDDEFFSPRAQESFGTRSVGGTYFVKEYMIPRGGSASFCLYDTRGLSLSSSSDNNGMIEKWMTRGVRHGEPVIWTSDSSELKDRMIRDGDTCSVIREVNFVIFVVNAVEILKSMESGTSYVHMISTAFNNPLLSFKDDKPVIVMTHGDMLLREQRARVQVFLGELLNIPPDKQIFDIPESQDRATELTVCNLLRYSLEHADKNLVFLPKRNFSRSKVEQGLPKSIIFIIIAHLFMFLVTIWFANHVHTTRAQNIAHEAQHKLFTFPSSPNNLSYEATQPKHCIKPQQNLDNVPKSEPMPKGEPSFDWRTTRGLWLEEEKVVEAEPRFDWRTTRRLWYVE